MPLEIFKPPLFHFPVPPTGPSPAVRIHLAFNRIARARNRGFLGRVRLAIRRLAWYPAASLLSFWYTLEWGGEVRRRTGKGRLRQIREQLTLALGHGIPPKAYFYFRLYDDSRRPHAAEYLHRFELKLRGIYSHLNKLREKKGASLSNKLRFHLHCEKHGIPAAPILLSIENGEIEALAHDRPELPPIDLITKPSRGRGGKGLGRWDWSAADACYENPEGERSSATALLEHLRESSQGRGQIVQPRLRNHPDLEDLSTGALTTARVMTCLNEAGGHEPVVAVFRMAVGSAVVDNIHAGGIASPVQLASGELGRATALDPRSDWLVAHPITGARIVGRKLPYWPEVLDLVVRAHQAFPRFVVIGWDVAITADGPRIVEGNSGSCVDLIQRPHDAPLGSGRLGELLAYHLERSFPAS